MDELDRPAASTRVEQRVFRRPLPSAHAADQVRLVVVGIVAVIVVVVVVVVVAGGDDGVVQERFVDVHL